MSKQATNYKDNIGYALGDFGMQSAFGLIASVLQKYYTDVLNIPIASVMILFIVARIWDAVNDPMWGSFVDSRKIKKGARYTRFMKYFSIPMGICTLLMFIKIPSLSTTGYFIYACITYILFGMVYTCVNVPYGSLASVISSNDAERAKLSSFRSIGAALGAIPSMLLIVLCYSNVDSVKVMSYKKILIGVTIIAFISSAFCLLCQKMVKERVVSPAKEKTSLKELFLKIFKIIKTRPFITLSISAMLYLAASVFSQSYFTYLADKYFNMQSLSMLAMVAQYLPIALLLPFIGKLNKKFGRKELCGFGCLISGIFYFVLYLIHTTNPWIFILFCLLAGFGNAFMFLQIWALATEVVDYNHLKYGIYDDAVSYSLFSFIRKLGHAISAIFVNASLLEIGYSVTNVTEKSLSLMYDSSVLIPGILYFIVFVLLCFVYPLNKKTINNMQLKIKENNDVC